MYQKTISEKAYFQAKNCISVKEENKYWTVNGPDTCGNL